MNCNKKAETLCSPGVNSCLFNIEDDPCELENLAEKLPEVVDTLMKRLRFYNETAVPPANVRRDPRGNPSNWDDTWTFFGDYLNLP